MFALSEQNMTEICFWVIKSIHNQGVTDELLFRKSLELLQDTDFISSLCSGLNDNRKIIRIDLDRHIHTNTNTDTPNKDIEEDNTKANTKATKTKVAKTKSCKTMEKDVVNTTPSSLSEPVVEPISEHLTEGKENMVVDGDDDPFSHPEFQDKFDALAHISDTKVIRDSHSLHGDMMVVNCDSDDDSDSENSDIDFSGFNIADDDDEPPAEQILSRELVEDQYDSYDVSNVVSEKISNVDGDDDGGCVFENIANEPLIPSHGENDTKDKVVKKAVKKAFKKAVKKAVKKALKEKVVKEKVVKEKVVKEVAGELGGELGGEKAEKAVKKEIIVPEDVRTCFIDWFHAHFQKHADNLFVDKSITTSSIAKQFFADSNHKITVFTSRLILSQLLGFRDRRDKSSSGVFDSDGKSFIQGFHSI